MNIDQFVYKYTIIKDRTCSLFIGKSAKIQEEFAQKDIAEKLESYFNTQQEVLIKGKYKGFQALLTNIKKAGYKITTNMWQESNPNAIVLAVISK